MSQSWPIRRGTPYRILSCDGGGIRGLLTCLLIEELESHCGVLRHVDLFAGTSAGSIISVALAAGVPVQKVVDFFAKGGPTIFTPFKPSCPSKIDIQVSVVEELAFWRKIWKTIAEKIDSLFFVKYTQFGVLSLLQDMLPDKRLNELRGVMVTTFQLKDSGGSWRPLLLANLPNSTGGSTHAIDAAMCSGAAPVFMPPYRHPEYGYCVDGGVFANNPCALAVAAAQNAGVAAEDIRVLSIGTGIAPCGMDVVPPPTNYGPLLWMLPFALEGSPPLPLLSMMSAILTDLPGSTATLQCRYMLGDNFMRADVPLSNGIAIDDYVRVPVLSDAAHRYMASSEWHSVEAWVRRYFVPDSQ